MSHSVLSALRIWLFFWGGGELLMFPMPWQQQQDGSQLCNREGRQFSRTTAPPRVPPTQTDSLSFQQFCEVDTFNASASQRKQRGTQSKQPVLSELLWTQVALKTFCRCVSTAALDTLCWLVVGFQVLFNPRSFWKQGPGRTELCIPRLSSPKPMGLPLRLWGHSRGPQLWPAKSPTFSYAWLARI